jgi:hypothetical protein
VQPHFLKNILPVMFIQQAEFFRCILAEMAARPYRKQPV